MKRLDLLLINPGGRELIYQDLGAELSAIEPPLWCRLIAGYILDRGYSVEILDSEAESLGPQSVAGQVAAKQPRLVGMVVFGHQPSASTQQMTGATPSLRDVKNLNPRQQIIIVGGHVAALPERTMSEEPVDFACNSEGPITIHALLQALDAGPAADFAQVPGLVWREGDEV